MVKIASAAAGAVVLAAAVAAQPMINTPPSVVQCQPVALQWSSATGTVRLEILPGGEVSGNPLETLPPQTGSSGSYVWTVDVAAGTSITIAVSDDSGTFGYSSPVTVRSSGDSSCLNASASSSSSSSGAAGGAGASSTSAASSSAATSSRASSSSAAPSSSSSSSAASSSATRASSTSGSASGTSTTAAAATSSRTPNAAAAFSPATAGLSVLAAAGALLPFL